MPGPARRHRRQRHDHRATRTTRSPTSPQFCDHGLLAAELDAATLCSGQTDYRYNAKGQLTEQRDPADAERRRRRTMHHLCGVRRPGISRRGEVTDLRVTSAPGAGLRPARPTSRSCTEYEYWGDTALVSARAAERQRDRRDRSRRGTATTRRPAALDRRAAARHGRHRYNRYDAFGRRTGRSRRSGRRRRRSAARGAQQLSTPPTTADQGRDRARSPTCRRSRRAGQLDRLHRPPHGRDPYAQNRKIREFVPRGRRRHGAHDHRI